MHFAYPPRKSSNPPPFRPRSGPLPSLRRGRLRTIGLGLLACILVLYLIFKPSKQSPYHERQPAGTPTVVLVTVLDTKQYSPAYLKTIRENREEYASRHGQYLDQTQCESVKSVAYRNKQATKRWSQKPTNMTPPELPRLGRN